MNATMHTTTTPIRRDSDWASTAKHSQQIAERIEQAYTSFAAIVRQFSRCTEAEAAQVTALYLKLKVAKLDAVHGVIRVTHGAYLDASSIRNAINLANSKA